MRVSENSISQRMLEREQIANRSKHWVRLVTACNHKCLFCLDMDTPRNVFLPVEEIKRELDRGRTELNADKVILSGGEASLHPKFSEIIAYGKAIGYGRVQCVTNGWLFHDKGFYERAVSAGLGELTFSLHGHTEALHDELTQSPGSFKKICKSILRARRDRRMITNIDVVINGMNIQYIDKIVELGISMGVREYDLLHIIPQSEAFRNRDRMFYDVREHLPKLQKVFRLTRLPGFYIWTNRFPIPYLEDLEDLIQDPHKMLDEVNGRRYQIARYIDEASPLNCRQPERCVHCFIEPFCTTMDRVVARQRAEGWEVWWVGDNLLDPRPAPPGVKQLGVQVQTAHELEALSERTRLGLYAQIEVPGPVPRRPNQTLVAHTPAHLAAWIDGPHDLVIHLTAQTAAWMLEHREQVKAALPRIHLHQPSHEKMAQAKESDVRNPTDFFRALNLRIRTSGLPACMTPGVLLVDEPALLHASIYDPQTGRPTPHGMAHYHIANRYRGKSVRCEDCRLDNRCEGPHINMIRDQGLRQVTPLIEGPWADEAARQLEVMHPKPISSLGNGLLPEPLVASLPGYAAPGPATRDPLAVIQEAKQVKHEARMARIAARQAKAAADKAAHGDD